MKTRHWKTQRGFTLAEILVAMVIFTIIMVAALMIYDRSNKVFKSSVEAAEMQQNTRAAFNRLVADVRMIGFDYDRDGVPSGAATSSWAPLTNYAVGFIVRPTGAGTGSFQVITAGVSNNLEPTWPPNAGDEITDGTVRWRRLGPVYQQPDEQLEFAGRSAITIRGNLDYSSDTANEHGREAAYEPGAGQFPLVTTGNDEIVTYALRRVNGSSPDTLQFYADVAMPRNVYPGGSAETLVSIPNVDLCSSGCNNPPYTLLRFTLDASGNPTAGVPIANNVRDLRFSYFTDPAGTVQLTAADGSALTQGAVGGLGRYDPANIGGTANWADRTQRSSVQSVRVTLTGMNEAPDPSYTNPNEAAGSPALRMRTYTLESKVSPRNIGLTGFSEPNPNPPGPPTMTSVCVGSCNVTRVRWSPPNAGYVSQYEVRYDTSPTGNFNSIGVAVPGDVVSAPVFSPPLVAGTLYYFKVVAINENGRSDVNAAAAMSRTPVNSTRPSPVADLTATEGVNAQLNQVTLTWTSPTTNDPALANMSCSGTSLSGTTIDPAEPIRFRIWRGARADFNPAVAGDAEIVLDNATVVQPTGNPGTLLTWIDDLTNNATKPPANCKDYYYRIQVYDTCSLSLANPAANNPNSMTTGQSTLYPVVGNPAIHGYATSNTTPSAPGQPAIDYTNSNSRCLRGPNTCDVKITWPAVTTDMSNPTQRITVDQYRITRKRKKLNEPAFYDETILPVLENASTDPALQEAGGAIVVYHDTTALDHDPNDKRKWYYQYTIQALQCGNASAPSPPIQFPASCGLAGSAVIEAGSRSGIGTLESPWQMNDVEADYIEVQDSLSLGIDRVEFEVYPEPNLDPRANPVARFNANSPPYRFYWQNQTDGAVFRVLISITNNSGCTEETERYIQDDPQATCPSSTVSPTGAASGAGIDTSPWVMGVGDKVTVNAPAGATISSVDFILTRVSDGAVIGSPLTVVAAPFEFTWANQVDSVNYKLTMRVAYTVGLQSCGENIERFIQDEPTPVCTGASATVSGQASGDGLAQGTPWLLNNPDVITIVPPVNGIINQVVFTVTPVSPAGPALPPVSDSVSPFEYTWTNQTDNTIYRVDAVITYAPGCTETVTRYVKDQQCSGATVAQSGSVGGGTGLTGASPWVFNAGDTATVTTPVGLSVIDVKFDLTDTTTSTVVSSVTDATSPYVSTWIDRVDNRIYKLDITVTYTAGCSEVITRYIQDQSLCFITASTGTFASTDSGSRKIATITYTITNPGTEVLTINGIQVGWLRDATHPDAILTNIVYNGTSTAVSAQTPPTTGLLTSISPAPPTIAAGSTTYTIAVVYDIGKKTDVGALAANWINSLCVRYTAPSFGGANAACNVIGSTTGNPSTCN